MPTVSHRPNKQISDKLLGEIENSLIEQQYDAEWMKKVYDGGATKKDIWQRVNQETNSKLLSKDRLNAVWKHWNLPTRSQKDSMDIMRRNSGNTNKLKADQKDRKFGDYTREQIKEMYLAGQSLAQLGKLTGVSAYTIRRALEVDGVEIRPLLTTVVNVLEAADQKGYNHDSVSSKYINENLSVHDMSEWLSEITGLDVSKRLTQRVIEKIGAQKPPEQLSEAKGRSARAVLKNSLKRLEKAGHKSPQDLADYFHAQKNITYFQLVDELNDKLDERDQLFTVRWLERNMMPLLPEGREKGSSRLERSVIDYVKSVYQGTIVENDRSVIGPFELDILIPELNIAIEVNGVYWHSSKFGKDKWYHYDKWKSCKDKGVQLIQIWEDDWNLRPDTVKSMLAHKLGVSTERKIGARSLTPVILTYPDVRDFFEVNHIQGTAHGFIYPALIDTNGDIKAAMVIARENERSFLISRYATSATVSGGFSKLLKFTEAHLKATIEHDDSHALYFTTFSDNEISDGGLYDSHGFNIVKEITPDYKYIRGGVRFHKFNFRKDRFQKDPLLKYEEGLTESQLAKLNDLNTVYDSGKVKWELTF